MVNALLFFHFFRHSLTNKIADDAGHQGRDDQDRVISPRSKIRNEETKNAEK